MDIFELYKEIDKEEVAPLYLMTGVEKYLYDQALEKMKESLLEPAMSSLNFHKLGEEATQDQVLDALDTLPMMDKRKLVVLERQKMQGTFDLSDLSAYIEAPSETTVFVLYLGTVDKRRKFTKSFQKKGRLVTFDRLTSSQCKGWLSKQFTLRQKKIDSRILSLLMDRTGYLQETSHLGLYDLLHLVERLCHQSGDTITEAQVIEEVKASVEHNIFLLTDFLSEGRYEKALTVFHALLDDGTAEMMITFMLVRHFRLMAKVALLKKDGYTPKLIAEKIGIHPYAAQKMSKQTMGKSTDYLKSALGLALGLEVDLKSKRVKASERIEQFVFQLMELENK